MSQDSKSKTEFEVAHEIKELLAALPAEKREMALRWARESVGLPTQSTAPQVPVPQSPPSTGEPAKSTELAESGGRSKSLRDFVAEKQPRSDVQFAVLVAYYHRFEAAQNARRESITAEDVQEGARLAGRERFRTPSKALNNALRLGYLDRAGDRGTYRLNAVGENLVAMTLPGNGSAAAPTAKPRRKTRATERVARDNRKRATKRQK